MMRRARVLTLVSLGVAWSTSLAGPGIGVLLEPRPVWQVLGLVGVVLFSVAHAGALYAAVTPVARAPWDAAFVVASLLSVPLLAPVAVGRWDTWAWVGASLVGTAPALVRRWWVMAPFVVVVAVVLSPEPLRVLVIAGGVGVGLALVQVLPVWLWDLVVQAQQGREARELAASALADLREAVHGYRAVELDEQASAIEQVLTSSEVRCTVSVPPSLPPAARELSWALREAGTNVLRHSRAPVVHDRGRGRR
jgi:two-component system sensor histidine kinase DesK